MARIADQLQVKVSDKGVESGKRRVSIEIESVADFFYLTDALSSEGVINELKIELKELIRKGVLSYVKHSRECLRKLKADDKPQKKTPPAL